MRIRCPHCHNPIEVIEEDPSGDVSCPSCGSSFNLATDISTVVRTNRMLAHFLLLDRVGQGAFGEVWKARDTELDRIVAVKIPRQRHLAQTETEQFLREARAAAQIRHPNIVSVHEVGRADGSVYIATDFIDGATLNEWVEAHPLTVRESAELCVKIADALHYAHAAGIIHRDLKPQNILMDTSGEPYVADFGLAKRDSGEITITVDGAILGTPAYMPPEQARGDAHHADCRSDVYSLGVILFRLLTGEIPFRGQRQMLIVQILNDDAPSLRKLDARIPRDVETICLKCLEKDPTRRYQTAANMAADLRRWLTGHPIEARPVSRTERTVRWCNRNRIVASLTVAVLLMLLLGMAATLYIVANARVIEANAKAIAAHENEIKTRDRQLAIRDIERTHAASHSQGWSDEIWENVTSLPALEGEADLRDALATSLIDLEAEDLYSDLAQGAEFMAFDANGERLVIGGVSGPPGTPPKVFNLATKSWHTSQVKGVGPVAFRSDGVPVVLIADPVDTRRIQLLDVSTSAEIVALTSNGPVHSDADEGKPLLALTADARFALVARTVETIDRKIASEVTVWKVETSEPIHRCIVESATSLSLTPDATLLAIGHSDGNIALWSVGNETAATEVKNGRYPVHALAFAKDYYRPSGSGAEAVPGSGWLLAAGDDAGGLFVWDLTIRQPRTVLRGAYYETLSLAFSPDSSLLFSAGRTPGRIWDVATGEQVLSWNQDSYSPGLAIGPHGLFASGGVPVFAPTASVRIQKLRSDRGGNVLRGLRDVPRHLSTSLDGSLIAAITSTFEVGVWRTDGTLQYVFAAPIGPFVDNATIAISPDNRELFCCTGDQALTWDLQSGIVSRTWKVAAALANESAYSPDGKHLYLARKEVIDRSRYPLSDAPSNRFPRILRAYDLLSEKGTEEPIKELEGIARNAYRAQVSRNGLLVLCGNKTGSPRTSATECWDLTSGKQLWSLPHDQAFDCFANMSPNGNRLLLSSNDKSGLTAIRDTRTAALLKEGQPIYSCDDEVQYSVATYSLGQLPAGGIGPDDRHVVVFPAGESIPLVSFYFEAARALDAQLFAHQQRTHLAWTNEKGHVAVVDLETIRRRLESVGLGW